MIPAIVEWIDAHADAYGWTAIEDLDIQPRVIRSCGWLLDPIKPDHTSIAQSVTDEHVDQVTHIPSINVLRIERL